MSKKVVIDLFCGAGGESIGIKSAMGGSIELHAVNHWERAIETHSMNFPEAEHHLTDVEKLDPRKITKGRKVALLWASPECIHFSNARGGKPKSEQSRSSAYEVIKWAEETKSDRIIIENVREFLTWGPLDKDGKPVNSRKGEYYLNFVSDLQRLGYIVDHRLLCAADYGAPTTRTRLFVQAVRKGKKILWPENSHSNNESSVDKKRWIPARDIIDWTIPGNSIFNRKRPLAAATIRRIQDGIKKYWGEWADPFLVILRGESSTRSIDVPAPAVTAGGGHLGLVEPFICQSEHGIRTQKIDDPLKTITCSSRGFGLVEPFILHQMTPGRPRSIDEPVPTITTISCHHLIQPFLVKYFGTGKTIPITEPLDTITTKDRFGLVEANQLDIRFRMLFPHELASAQGFPKDYVFAGNKTEQIRQIGNAVCSQVAAALVRSSI